MRKKTLFKNFAELLEGIENLCQVIGEEKNKELCKVAAVPRDCKSWRDVIGKKNALSGWGRRLFEKLC